MTDEITQLITSAQTLRREAADLLGGISDAALNAKPSANEWSIGQQFDHLRIVDGLVLPKLRVALDSLRADNKRSEGPFRYRGMDALFLKVMKPTGLMRLLPIPVPPLYEPTTAPLLAAPLAAQFDALQAAFLTLLADADGWDLLAIKVSSPANEKVVLSLGAWLNGLAAHDRYHVNKAAGVRARAGFPAD